MRAFIVLCLVAVTCADKLGYNYQPVAHSNSGLSVAPGSGINYGSASDAIPSYGGQDIASSGIPQGDYSSAANDAPAFAPQAELDKEYYTYTANDDDFSDPDASNKLANSIKQALRVVFIKGPENKGLEDAALALAKQASEQKTAIYVLNKQADLNNLAQKFNNLNKNNDNKPEVHFVKYRTPEDAANAQKAIQGQYDSLGDSGKSYDGGVAPVLNFASKAPSNSYNAPASGVKPSSTYLPASVLRS